MTYTIATVATFGIIYLLYKYRTTPLKEQQKYIANIVSSLDFTENAWVKSGTAWPPEDCIGGVSFSFSVHVLCETNDGQLFRGYLNRIKMEWVIIIGPGDIEILHSENLKQWKYIPSFNKHLTTTS